MKKIILSCLVLLAIVVSYGCSNIEKVQIVKVLTPEEITSLGLNKDHSFYLCKVLIPEKMEDNNFIFLMINKNNIFSINDIIYGDMIEMTEICRFTFELGEEKHHYWLSIYNLNSGSTVTKPETEAFDSKKE